MSADSSQLRLLAVDLGEAPDRVTRKASTVVRKTLRDIESTSKQINAATAFDTGNLNNGIGTDTDGDGLGGVVGPTAEYAPFVEHGTDGPYEIPNAFGWGITVMHPGNAPQPFMGPAFDRHEPRFTRALGQIVGDIF